MKIAVYLFLLTSIFISCSRSVIGYGATAEENEINLSDVKVGMDTPQVRVIMGPPHKSEKYVIDDSNYLVWYYITEPVFLGQTRLISKNYMPLVFKDGYLKGWGWQFYNVEFNVENKKNQKNEALRQKYTNDKEEWPVNEHQYIAPMKTKKNEENGSDVNDPSSPETNDDLLNDQKKTPEKPSEKDKDDESSNNVR
ncbi:MAG: hypothetical protein A3F40_00695, partial [Chlamydiae bacterium RIFCSPHIGHO2_12_FULL_27_8]